MLGAPESIISMIKKSMGRREVNLTSGKIEKKEHLSERPLSPLLFVMSLIPLTLVM